MEDQRIDQIIDANLDRAREGLRVIEDWCRFGLKQKDFVITLKSWRQQLGALHKSNYKDARSVIKDPGIGLTHPAQNKRLLPIQVVEANCARVQEALRVLEEFSRSRDLELHKLSSSIRYALYDLEIKLLQSYNSSYRHQKLQESIICLITTPKPELHKTIEAAIKAGITMVQYRCKKGNDIDKFNEANELATLCKNNGALFIVNDRIDIALATNADGVHLGQSDMSTRIARELIGINKLIGRSTNSIKQIEAATEEGCDYLGFGPIYTTQTKPQLVPIGLNDLTVASKKTTLPLFAIGGINSSNARAIRSAGAKRIALVGAIMGASDPTQACHELIKDMT